MDSLTYTNDNQSIDKKSANLLLDVASLNINNQEFEYDEDFGSDLVAEQEIDDVSLLMGDSKIGNGQFTSESLIEEDYEAELGAAQVNYQESIMESDSEKKINAVKERIDRYGIVNVCGSDKMGRPIILVSACKLPDSSEILQHEKEFFLNQQHFFDTLLEVLSSTLDQYVEAEYTLVYLHYGLKSTSQPSFHWLAKVYKILDRKFKKNLKALFIVHPTTLVKVLWNFISPLTSSKVKKKITYCNTLDELSNHIDREVLKIPDEVLLHDSQIKTKKFSFPKRSNSSTDDSINQNSVNTSNEQQYGPFQQFKVSLDTISKNNNGDCIPLCVKEAVIFIRQHLDEEGLFRRSGSQIRIREIQQLYNMGQPVAYEDHEVHVAACVLKAFYRELPESLLPETIFNELMSLQVLDLADKVEVAKDLLNAKLPPANMKALKFLIEFLNEVAAHASVNKMDAKNLSYVFGPNFMRQNIQGLDYGLINTERINNFVELLIKYHSEIFSS